MGRFFTKLWILHFIQWLILSPAYANLPNSHPLPTASCEEICNADSLDLDKNIQSQCSELSASDAKECKSCVEANFTSRPSVPYCESLTAFKAANTALWVTAIAYTGAATACMFACVTEEMGKAACEAAQLAMPFVDMGAQAAFGANGLDGVDNKFKGWLARNEKQISSAAGMAGGLHGLVLLGQKAVGTGAKEGTKAAAKEGSKEVAKEGTEEAAKEGGKDVGAKIMSCVMAGLFAFTATAKYSALLTVDKMKRRNCDEIKDMNRNSSQQKPESASLACRPPNASRVANAPAFEYEDIDDGSIVLAGEDWSRFSKLRTATKKYLKANPPDTLGMENHMNLEPIRERFNQGMTPSEVLGEMFPGGADLSEAAGSDPTIKAMSEKLAGFGRDPSVKYSSSGAGKSSSSDAASSELDISSLLNQLLPKKPNEEDKSGLSGTEFGSKKDLEDAEKLGIHTDNRRNLFEIITRRMKMIRSANRVLSLEPVLKQNKTASKK